MTAPSPAADAIAEPRHRLNPAEIAAFRRDGFVIRRQLFDPAELAPLAEACRRDPGIDGALVGIADSSGNLQEVVSWTELGDDLLGVIPRLARLVEGAEALLGTPVYHWHSKLSMKRPGSAGRWDWHQDYGYWYHEGCLYPDLVTCMVAVDPATEANGCVKLVRGSHLAGRIEHGKVGEASGVDPARLEKILARHEVVPCALAPGDAAFFHANTLHASGPNRSAAPRSMIHFSYNAVHNSPFIEGQERHAYRPLAKLADDSLRAGRFKTVFSGQSFHLPDPSRPANSYGYKVLRHAARRATDGMM